MLLEGQATVLKGLNKYSHRIYLRARAALPKFKSTTLSEQLHFARLI